MIDGFKSSLNQISNLMWTTIALSVTLLLLEPTTQTVSVFGLPLSTSRVVVVVPICIIGLLLARQIFIRNVIDIVQQAKDKPDMKELQQIVSSYPLLEFMRWRFKSDPEVFILTAFQVLFDMVPGLSLIIYSVLAHGQDISAFVALYATSFIVIYLGLWNYRSLRRKVFEALVGPISTPD